MTIKVNSVKARQVSAAMLAHHARKREKMTRYEEALIKIHRLPTTNVRARNIAAKALNGHLNGK
jgi:hypothetical protein